MTINNSQPRLTEKVIIVSTSITLLLLLIPSVVFTQNLTSNPNMDLELAPWTATLSVAPDPDGFGSVMWTDTYNADNLLNGSGSAQVQLSLPPMPPNSANASSGFRQCLTLADAPVTVISANYGAHVLVPVNENPINGFANASIEVRFFTDMNCLDFIPGAGGNQGMDLNGTLSDTDWYVLGDSNLSMPNGQITASSVEVRGFLRATDTSSEEYIAFFDNIFIVLDLIFKNGFEELANE